MEKIYDFAGIGIGPFNLGLAALSTPIDTLQTIFLDEKAAFNWHPGMLLYDATLQVPFYADLVTLADPSSKFSFLAFLKATGRLIQFGIHDQHYVTRREYNRYCRWVIGQMDNLYFGYRVEMVKYNSKLNCYILYIRHLRKNTLKTVRARRLVIGVGTVPYLPHFVQDFLDNEVFHSSDYLFHKEAILSKRSVTLVGSGQSAAEIFYDLLSCLEQFTGGLHWFTRAERFYPMEYSKLSHEMTSPDYIDYFFNLSPEAKESVLRKQNMLYKGINYTLINQIYDRLYTLTIEGESLPLGLFTNMELRGLAKGDFNHYTLNFFHTEQQQSYTHEAEAIILATGYQAKMPSFLDPVHDLIQWDEKGRYRVNRNYSIDLNAGEIFIQNAELHTHGFNAPDLGMGAYRNAYILNEMLGYDFYPVEQKIAFQEFGIPQKQCENNCSSLFR